VTLRIEGRAEGERTILRLSGRIESIDLDELRTAIARNGPAAALDLEQVTLVDLAAVQFLCICESDGIELLHCARYIREWIGRERAER
jgi:anti-anti-sigma regulatory factor